MADLPVHAPVRKERMTAKSPPQGTPTVSGHAERALHSAVEREILRPLWKIHILHHAAQQPIIGNWMLEELREHGYKVSPGTLYPLLRRMEGHGWLLGTEREPDGRGGKPAIEYTLTAAGLTVLHEVRERLLELEREVLAEHPG